MTESPPPEDPRVRFAGERTLLAWVRTGLSLMGFGFVVARFSVFLHELAAMRPAGQAPATGLSVWVGVALVALGVVVVVLAAVEHALLLRRIGRGEPFRPTPWSLGIVVAAALSVGGIALVGYLIGLRQ
jgi:putative membrane protein